MSQQRRKSANLSRGATTRSTGITGNFGLYGNSTKAPLDLFRPTLDNNDFSIDANKIEL